MAESEPESSLLMPMFMLFPLVRQPFFDFAVFFLLVKLLFSSEQGVNLVGTKMQVKIWP